jgi:hypothetical protein
LGNHKNYDPEILTFELYVSQGKGFRTPELEDQMIKLCKKNFEVKQGQYRCYDDERDVYSYALMKVLESWKKCDLDYGGVNLRNGAPYLIQIFKMALAWSCRYELHYSDPQMLSLEKLTTNNVTN